MRLRPRYLALGALLAACAPILMLHRAKASDHADTPEMASNPGFDITDVYIFPSPENASNVVLVMNVHPLITPATKDSVSFDPNVLYQFKIDTDGDKIEDRVIQARFTGTGATQKVSIAGPARPGMVGTTSSAIAAHSTTGAINTTFSPTKGMKVFAGVREDPFFFDLERFFQILPDRATPITGTPVANPNDPQATSWRAPGQAVDFLSNGGYNVLSIVVEMPKKWLGR